MIFNMSGGGASLNFRILGGTVQPDSLKENDIWVNTDAEISGWIFSATEPAGPVYGLVWFDVNTSSNVQFNALKKNGIQVYPIYAKQRIDGSWIDKEAFCYQSGEWKPLDRYLVRNGIELHGEFVSCNWDSSKPVTPTISRNDGNINISGTSSNNAFQWGASLDEPIDLTNVNTLYLRCDATAKGGSYPSDGGGASIFFNCGANNGSKAAASVDVVAKGSVTNVVKSLDVSALTGLHYVGLAGSIYASGTKTLSVTVYDIWPE